MQRAKHSIGSVPCGLGRVPDGLLQFSCTFNHGKLENVPISLKIGNIMEHHLSLLSYAWCLLIFHVWLPKGNWSNGLSLVKAQDFPSKQFFLLNKKYFSHPQAWYTFFGCDCDFSFRSLLVDLPRQRLEASIVSYGAAVNACERAEQWTQAIGENGLKMVQHGPKNG